MKKQVNKSIVSAVMSVSLIFGIAAPSFAASTVEDPQTSISSTQKTLYTSDGELLGSVKRTTEVVIVKDGTGANFSVTEHNDYDLEPKFAAIVEYQEQFKDGIETNTYVIKDNEIYHDGELLSVDSPSAKPQTSEPLFSLMQDTGGVPTMSHYYSTNDLNTYTFATYSDVTFLSGGFMGPKGSHVQKTTKYTNSRFYAAKSSVDSFEDNYDDFKTAITGLQIAGATFIGTWETVIGAILGGAGMAVAGSQLVNSYNDCKDDIAKAYMYVSAF